MDTTSDGAPVLGEDDVRRNMNDRELLIRIDEQVTQIREDLARGERRMNGHAARIRALERWRSGIVAALGAMGLGGAAKFFGG